MELWRNGERLFSDDGGERTEVAVEGFQTESTDFRIFAVDQAGNESWSENYRVYVGAEGKKQRKQEDSGKRETEVWGQTEADRKHSEKRNNEKNRSGENRQNG